MICSIEKSIKVVASLLYRRRGGGPQYVTHQDLPPKDVARVPRPAARTT